MKSKQKAPGKCIFCGGEGMTKQHLWPMWLKKIILETSNKNSQLTFNLSHSRNKNSVVVQPNYIEKEGPVGSRKLRIVCAKCNNGWMSSVEQQAQKVLTNLILDERTQLSPEELHKLSKWILLNCIVWEFTDKQTMCIPYAQRKSFYENKEIPEGWQIWIGRYQGSEWFQRYYHIGALALPMELVDEYHHKYGQKGNCHFATLGLGKVIIHAVSTPPDINNLQFLPNVSQKLIKIFPLTNEEIEWGLTEFLSDTEATFISRYFGMHLNHFYN